jgi:hypothetical protein
VSAGKPSPTARPPSHEPDQQQGREGEHRRSHVPINRNHRSAQCGTHAKGVAESLTLARVLLVAVRDRQFAPATAWPQRKLGSGSLVLAVSRFPHKTTPVQATRRNAVAASHRKRQELASCLRATRVTLWPRRPSGLAKGPLWRSLEAEPSRGRSPLNDAGLRQPCGVEAAGAGSATWTGASLSPVSPARRAIGAKRTRTIDAHCLAHLLVGALPIEQMAFLS